MKISVIIPSFNRKHHLINTVPALISQSLSKNNYEIIVVDDGSDDGTKELVFGEHTYLIPLPNCQGAAFARNVGLSRANGDVIVFLDADILVTHRFLDEIKLAHSMYQNDVILGPRKHLPQGAYTIDDSQSRHDTRKKLLNRYECDIHELRHPWSFAYTCNLSLRKLHIPTQGFDPSFKGWGLEDVEFGYRLFKQKMSFRLLEELTCYHIYHPREITEEKFKEWKKNLQIFMQKHPEPAVQKFSCFVDVFDPLIKADYFDMYDQFQGMVNGNFSLFS